MTPTEERLRRKMAQMGPPKTQSGNVDRLFELARHDFDTLARHAELKPDDAVLDVGCGYGRLALAFAGGPYNYLGVDVSAKRLAYATQLFLAFSNVSFLHLDLANPKYNRSVVSPLAFGLALPDGAFRAAAAVSLFTHIPDEAVVRHYLKEIHRLLAPGGAFLSTWLTDPPLDATKSDTRRAVFRESDVEAMLTAQPWQTVVGGGNGTADWHLRLVARKA